MAGQQQWLSLAACLVCALNTGIAYSFGVWSGALKHEFNLKQNEVDTIGSIQNLGGFFTWLPGMLSDLVGPR